MRRKIIAQITALSLLMCFLAGAPIISFNDLEAAVYEYQSPVDNATYQVPQGLHHTHHHPVRAYRLEKIEILHTPIELNHEPVSFVPFLHRKQSNQTLIHSRPPNLFLINMSQP